MKIGYTAATFAPDFEISNGDAGIIRLSTNNTERMRIDGSTGNIGIGSTGPGYKLTLEDSSDFAIHLLKTGASDGWVRNKGNLDLAAASGGAGGQVISFSNGANFSGLTQRMMMDGNGDLLLNSTSLGFANQRAIQLQAHSTGLINIQHLNTEVSGAAYIWFPSHDRSH